MTFVEAPAPWQGEAGPLIERGLVAKVGFAADDGISEWMFVHVTAVADDGSMSGVLLNRPVEVSDVDYGDLVAGFGREHVYEARIDPNVGKYSKAALVARN